MSFEGLAPQLAWGLIPRFVGLLYVLGFAALIRQHDVMPGAAAHYPWPALRARIRRDFPGIRRFFDVPSLLWLTASDRTMRTMPIIGTLCGGYAIYGGPYTFYALLVAFMLWLSLEMRGLVFPWDTMLQEIGFLVLFLPMPQALPNLHASALPLPSVAFMARWFVLRLMLGFGKEKFIGANKSDLLYLRGFLVWMPLPTPLGWLAHHAPAWMLRGMLLFMFCAEVIAPVLGLFSGPLRLVSFALLVSLMVGIHVTGNWAFFNIGYILLCVSLLDTQSSLLDLAKEPWSGQLLAWPDVAVHALMAVMFVVSLFYLPNNSWLTRTWVNWPADIFAIEPKWMPLANRIHRALEPLRRLAPFRIVNGYGVFTPHAMPPIRLVPVFEGSDDGVHWKRYGYKHMPVFEDARPPIIAPYHARLDQYTYYVGMGFDAGSLFGSLFPYHSPYSVNTRVRPFDVFMQRILRHDQSLLRMLGRNPFPDRPPRLVRIGLLGMTPTRLDELRATGKWWHIRRFGTFFPARGLESWSERNMFPEPELFHPDLVAIKRRARAIRLLEQAFASGMSADQAVLEGSDLTTADVERFWNDLVPMLAEGRGALSRIHERAAAISARFDVDQLLRLERVLERYAWLLRLRTEPYRFGQTEPSLPVMSNFRYHMLLHELVIEGRQAYEAVLAEPARAAGRVQHSTDATQIWVLSLLRYDQLMTHICTFRGSEIGVQGRDQQLPGLFEYYDLLVQIVPPGEEFCPRFVKHPDGEHTIDGFYPPPAPVLGDSRPAKTAAS
jgi:hypothetical protein